MTFTFGNATVKRLEVERQLAERLNHLRFYKITECLFRIYQGTPSLTLPTGSILASEPCTTGCPSLSAADLPGSVGIIIKVEVVKPSSIRINASACIS